MKSIESKNQGGGVFRSFSEADCCSGSPLECCSRQLPGVLKNGLRTESKLYSIFIHSLRYNSLRFTPLKQVAFASLLCGQGLAPFLSLSMLAAVSIVNDAGSGFSLAKAEPRQLCLDSCFPILSPKY